MSRNINYKDNLFERANLNPIRGEPTFKTIHKLRNEIKSNIKSVWSNLWGWVHGHLGLLLTDAHYALISPTPFAYPTHPGPLIILDGTNAHTNSNMQIVHTEEVRLFLEVTGVEQALVQQIFGTVEEAYLSDIRNRTTNFINNTVVSVLKHLQEKYGQLIPHELLDWEEIVSERKCSW